MGEINRRTLGKREKNMVLFIEILLIGVGLSMDAFAVSICKGLSMKRMNWKNAIIIVFYFGAFQAIMPAIGYFLGTTFESFVTAFDHWIAFVLLAFIGGNMIKESFSDDDDEKTTQDNIMSFKNLTILAIATSIDALAVGVTFAFVDSGNIWFSSTVIGVVAFVISYAGVMLGKKISGVFQSYAERVGGCVLVIIGLKILIEHLFFS